MHDGLCKALMLGIAYCASIGGTGMLTGTGPNLIIVNQAAELYDFSINFVNWASFATPVAIVMTIIAWCLLVFTFLMVKGDWFRIRNYGIATYVLHLLQYMYKFEYDISKSSIVIGQFRLCQPRICWHFFFFFL